MRDLTSPPSTNQAAGYLNKNASFCEEAGWLWVAHADEEDGVGDGLFEREDPGKLAETDGLGEPVVLAWDEVTPADAHEDRPRTTKPPTAKSRVLNSGYLKNDQANSKEE